MKLSIRGFISLCALSIIALLCLLLTGFIFNSPSSTLSQVEAAHNPSFTATPTVSPSPSGETTVGPTNASTTPKSTSPTAPTDTPAISPSPAKLGPSNKPVQAAVAVMPATPLQNLSLEGYPVAVYQPASTTDTPVQLLVVLHGMNGNGQSFCQPVLDFARQNHMMVLAPTFDYNQDYRVPEVVAAEDGKLTRVLNGMITELSEQTHTHLKSQILLYGFSRGSQLALHYAMVYPQTVRGMVLFAGGAYTLPYASYGKPAQKLNFPIGIADLSQYSGQAFDRTDFTKIPLQIEVGQDDTDATGVSRAWDNYEGTTRLQRAESYYHLLRQMGQKVTLQTFPGAGHEVSPQMNAAALKFFLGLPL